MSFGKHGVLTAESTRISSWMWFRNRTHSYPLDGILLGPEVSSRRDHLPSVNVDGFDTSNGGSTERLLATANLRAMIILVVFLYALIGFCRLGFGWDPTHDPAPPTYALHIPGITDDPPVESLFVTHPRLRIIQKDHP